MKILLLTKMSNKIIFALVWIFTALKLICLLLHNKWTISLDQPKHWVDNAMQDALNITARSEFSENTPLYHLMFIMEVTGVTIIYTVQVLWYPNST